MWNRVNNVTRDPIIWVLIRTMVHRSPRGVPVGGGGWSLGVSGQNQVSCRVLYTGTNVTCTANTRVCILR